MYQILPHSVPTLIYDSPQDFNALDFKVVIDHDVFDIVPPTLGKFIKCCYDRMGCPEVTRSSAWMVYRNLLSVLQLADNVPPTLLLNKTETNEDDVLPLLEGCSDLPFCDEPNGPYYMGGVGGRLGLDTSHHNELDALVDDDEPDIPQHTLVEQPGLVVWDFSDDEHDSNVLAGDEW
ncbi:uncharacterized protein F5147DRAFT_778349 [Suillus discolor]|uniref:Uncharacterized protein n=1 Tax=Suillus discolor TaxID=1912936 RepID=A0A9P7JPA2_9AGAM|nr:uncharacterized protein F5147DRAFT_778349 [Suillus discolor]KAG2096300.1 hypothetical protein F5147DRAFT_778349 [Suillus discolor]